MIYARGQPRTHNKLIVAGFVGLRLATTHPAYTPTRPDLIEDVFPIEISFAIVAIK